MNATAAACTGGGAGGEDRVVSVNGNNKRKQKRSSVGADGKRFVSTILKTRLNELRCVF